MASNASRFPIAIRSGWINGLALYLAVVFVGYGFAWRDFSKKLLIASSDSFATSSGAVADLKTEGFGMSKSYKFRLASGAAEFELLPTVYDRPDLDAALRDGVPVSVSYNSTPPFYVVALSVTAPSVNPLIPPESGIRNLQRMAESGSSRGWSFILFGLLIGSAPWSVRAALRKIRKK